MKELFSYLQNDE
jgi:DNA-binding CsgD family transcriptional regulator